MNKRAVYYGTMLNFFEFNDEISIPISSPVRRFHRMLRHFGSKSAENQETIDSYGINPDRQPNLVYFLRAGYLLINPDITSPNYGGQYFSTRARLGEFVRTPTTLPLILLPKKYLEMFNGHFKMFDVQQAQLLSEVAVGDRPFNTTESISFSELEPSLMTFVTINPSGQAYVGKTPLITRTEARALINFENKVGDIDTNSPYSD